MRCAARHWSPPSPSATLSFIIYFAFPHNSPTIFLSQRFACFAGQIIGFILGFILYSQCVSSPHAPPPRRHCTVPAAQHAQRNTHNHALSSLHICNHTSSHAVLRNVSQRLTFGPQVLGVLLPRLLWRAVQHHSTGCLSHWRLNLHIRCWCIYIIIHACVFNARYQ